MKLLETNLYYYCLPDKFKKQISTYLCEVINNDHGAITYKDPNGKTFSVDEKDLNFTRFLGLVDAEYALVFSLIGENLNIEEAEKTIRKDSIIYLEGLTSFAKKD